MKKIAAIIVIIFTFFPTFSQYTQAETNAGQIYQGDTSVVYRNVTVYAPAVASTESGYLGVISTITVTIQNNGSGRVFVDTLPLTQIDMQGSARLAVKVASALVSNDINSDVNPSKYDYFFVVRTNAPIIGGPSAGAIMTLATICLLENWTINNETIMTGMINPDGSIGPIGGIPQKIDAAYSVGAKRFLIPKGQGTYTEMVTTTETSNGWIRTVTRPVTRNIAEYAWDNYGIEVVEVAEINEAVENFTGYRFAFEEGDSEITTEQYIQSMQPLASRLLENATTSYNNASLKFNNSSIPNYFPTYYRNNINQELQRSKQTLEKSNGWYDQHLYYTSTSKSFQSLISSRLVIYACDYYDSGNISYLEKLLEDAQSLYGNKSKQAEKAQINGFITLQSVGAAQRRASESKQYLDAAVEEFDYLNSFSDVISFLEKIAFAVERINSIGWWIDIGTKFNDTGELTNGTIENLALEYIDEATQADIYSSVILEETGGTYSESTDYLNDAETLIETARDDLDRDYPAAALFEALEALAYANLAIEIIGTEPEQKLKISSERASNNIAKSRKQGVEPVLAVSYYEYAESLRNESNNDAALIYYKYSGMIAGVLGFTNVSIGISSSIDVGIPDFKPYFNIYDFGLLFLIGIFLLGGVAGLGLGLIVGGLFKDNKPKRPKKRGPGSYSQDYKLGFRDGYRYPNEEIPRSIRDFYKKNK
jgi:uncharacterized protein